VHHAPLHLPRVLSGILLIALATPAAAVAEATATPAEVPAPPPSDELESADAAATGSSAPPSRRRGQPPPEAPSGSIEVLDEIVVTGSRVEVRRDDAPVDTLLITRREIEASGARDVSDLLATQPGVEIVRDGISGAGLRLQGLEDEHVLVLIDGQRIPGRVRGKIDLSRYTTDNVSSIEIVRGAASSLYGSDAMGGVINIITRRRAQKPVEGSVQLRADTLSGYELRANVGVSNETSLLRLGGGTLQTESFRLGEAAEETSGSARNDLDLDLRAEHQLSSSLRLVGTASFIAVERSSVDLGAGTAIFDRTDRTEILDFSLAPELRLGEGHSLRFTAHYSFLDNQLLQDQRRSDALDQYQRTSEDLWETSVIHDVQLGSHRLTSGAEILYERLDSPRLDDGEGERFRPALFVQDDWVLAEEQLLAVTPGLRLDHDSDFGNQLSPKLSARYAPIDSLLLRANYGWGFRAASFQELLIAFDNPSVGYRVEGNPELEPESSRGGSLGLTFQPSSAIRLDMSVFRNDLENLITVDTLDLGGPGRPMRMSYVNVDRALTQGAEGSIRYKPWRILTLDAGYTYTHARNVTEETWLSGRPWHRATFGVTWRPDEGAFTANLRGEWVGTRPFISLEDGTYHEAAPYTYASLRVSQDLGNNLSLFAGGENLLNEGDPRDLTISPRTIFAGIHAKY